LALGAGFALVAFFFWPTERTPSLWENAALETAGDNLMVALKDGSRMELGAETRVLLNESEPSAVNVSLQRGRVECDVVPKRDRRFSVVAAGIEVRVTGTRFSVEVAPRGDRVVVEVMRGSVEVRRPGNEEPLRRLGSGERWSAELSLAEAAVAADSLNAPGSVGISAGTVDAVGKAAPSSALDPGTVAEPSLGQSDPSPAQPPAVRESVPAPSVEPEAKELLEQANAARRDGNVVAAAEGYERLLKLYPNDGRAGLAAFELGRLRMDRFHDFPGAATALKRAVTLAPGSGFREDAMARLVDAYQAMGAGEQCARAKRAYLDGYPQGVHAAKVKRACSAK
jgi:transmembrane sensor